jgi:sigma-B regulation protein RsbU (phosphoserine phosphatase)
MRGRALFPKPLLASFATLFALVAIAYGSMWMYVVRQSVPRVELGFNVLHNAPYDLRTHSQAVEDVAAGSPAERAGLRPGDRVIGINERALDTDLASNEAYVHGRPGDPVEFTVERAGEPQPLTLHGVFRAAAGSRESDSIAKSSAQQITGSFPVPFLLVGFAVLFLRLEEPNAWLLALLFSAFAAAPPVLNFAPISPALRIFGFAFRAVFAGMLAPLFYLFFAVFPLRSPLDRRLPWLKWAGLLFGACIVIPGLRTGDPRLPQIVARLVGSRNAGFIDAGLNYDLLALGLIALAQNSFMAAVPLEARRKSRVILWGTVVGVLPIVVERMATDFVGFHPSFWLDTALVLVLFVYPLSFAYAVVKHRVLEIPVLLKRSARFLLAQWGVHILGVVATTIIVLLLARAFAKDISAHPEIAVFPVFGLGALMLWLAIVGGERVNKRLDRAFFRSAYDARLILENLAEKTRTATTRQELATLLEQEIGQALHPQLMVMYQSGGNGKLFRVDGDRPDQPQTIPADLALLSDLARRGQPWEVPPPDSNLDPGLLEELTAFAPLRPECLVPMPGRESRLAGLLVLGARLSEEPYSGEDRRLLASVASQAGVALEGIGLTERMAERMDAERRSRRELEMARQVQARLFPQKLPTLRTLQFVGCCIQARQVGGDYYDFLELAPERLGLVLADIAGKGFSGALLMANLQANLRSQYAMAIDDLPRVLTSVNHLFYESTDAASYATLFFADYDDTSRKLRYANCGHLPPLLLRAHKSSPDGQVSEEQNVERLDSTCTVMGLFEDWHCEVAEVRLAAGDTLVLYTDGVTEAENADGEEFGASHLLDVLRRNDHLPVGLLLQAVVDAVQEFSGGGEQQDDITLVVARCTA